MSEASNGNGKPHHYPGKRRGPKSKWGKIDPIKVAALAGKLGATESELAAALGVSTITLQTWKRDNEKLLCTLRTEKAKADQQVVKSLFQRAKGYSHEAVKIVVVEGKVKKIKYTEHYPPDTTACVYWLKNRDPLNWRDRLDHSVSNPDGTPISNTTVIAPTVVFVQPKKEELTEAIEVKQVGNGKQP